MTRTTYHTSTGEYRTMESAAKAATAAGDMYITEVTVYNTRGGQRESALTIELEEDWT